MMPIRPYIIKNMFSLKINKKFPLEKCLLVVEVFGSLVPYVKTENDIKLCLSTWVTLCPNMAERCRHTKFRLYSILFVYALLVHSLVGHIPNIDCVICLWVWNIVVMILVTINERQQVLSLQKHCSVDLYFFSPTLKRWYNSQKQAKKNNKLSNRSITAFTLKATNCFNIEIHHM